MAKLERNVEVSPSYIGVRARLISAGAKIPILSAARLNPVWRLSFLK